MEILPAIDLRGGRCVRLVQGDYDRETVFSDDPVATAQRWVSEGATRLHVVDLDGAREGQPVNDAPVRAIIAAVSVPVQVAGGVRDLAAVERWLAAGAARVVLGSAAVREPAFAEEAVRRHDERIAVSVDGRDGYFAAEGWRERTDQRVDDLLRLFYEMGVPRFIYTDIGVDGTLTQPNYEAVAALVAATPAPLIAAGGVAMVEHLVRLAALGVEGAIVGRALYEGNVRLPEALAAVSGAPSA